MSLTTQALNDQIDSMLERCRQLGPEERRIAVQSEFIPDTGYFDTLDRD